MPSRIKLLMEQELARRYPSGTDYLVVGFDRLSAPESAELRRHLRQHRARIQVVKNSIARRVLEANRLGEGAGFIEGPSALVTGEVEMPELCRLIMECVEKLEDKLFVRGGRMGDTALTPELVSRLASIPPMDVLRGRMLGAILAPVAGLAGGFQALLRSIVYALDGIRKQKEDSSSSGPHASDSGASAGESGASG